MAFSVKFLNPPLNIPTQHEKVTFDEKYKNFLAPQDTPIENSNILIKIGTQINVQRGGEPHFIKCTGTGRDVN